MPGIIDCAPARSRTANQNAGRPSRPEILALLDALQPLTQECEYWDSEDWEEDEDDETWPDDESDDDDDAHEWNESRSGRRAHDMATKAPRSGRRARNDGNETEECGQKSDKFGQELDKSRQKPAENLRRARRILLQTCAESARRPQAHSPSSAPKPSRRKPFRPIPFRPAAFCPLLSASTIAPALLELCFSFKILGEFAVATFAVIVAAAGKSTRFHDKNYKKPFAPLANRAVWLHSAEKFLNRGDVKQVILLIGAEDREYFDFKFAANVMILGIQVVEGGKERSDSIRNALAKVKPEIDFVAVHDAARPCLADEWIDRVFDTAERTGAAILASPVSSTLKRVDKNNKIQETVSREGLWEAQTPQVFKRQLLIDAYAKLGNRSATDDAGVVEQFGHEVSIVTGSPINLKITTREDLRFAEQALKALPKPKFDNPAHPFADDALWR